MTVRSHRLKVALRVPLPALSILLGIFVLTAGAAPSEQTHKLLVTVVDENGIPVAAVRLLLERVNTQSVSRRETDYAGRHEFGDLPAGVYHLRVEKEGFYAVVLNDVRVGETEILEITLNHQQEFAEVVQVVYSPPAIDPAKTATSEHLSSQEIIALPYPTTRDLRNALPLLPGVLQDATGQVHVNGAATSQILDQLDGFNITHPTSGLLALRVSVDALRSIEVLGSRYSAEYGKGSGGVLDLATGMGDDRYRFSATDFIPSLQSRKGIHLDNWTPRVNFSGPLRRGKAWFYQAAEGEYGLTIFEELPAGADRAHLGRASYLARAQVNLKSANLLTASFLANYLHSDHAGLSPFNPLPTTLDQRQTAYLITVKDQSYLSNHMLLEMGAGFSQFRDEQRPLGSLPYVLRPEGSSGNFFRTADGRAHRLQWIANLSLPAAQWHGRHEFRLGTDIDRISYRQLFDRRAISIQREDGTRSREITFVGSPRFRRNNVEVSGYAQDRWSLSDRLLLELGLRFDWDQIVRSALVSPRFASSYLLTREGDTKLAAGIGLFPDAPNLDFLARPLAGQRFDVFYAANGQTPLGAPVATSFQINQRNIRTARALNWSVGVEHKLRSPLYLRVEFVQKRGGKGFAYVNANPGQLTGPFELRSIRRDRFDSFQATVRRTFKGNYEVLASYTRSATRSNALLDFTIDNPILSPQAGGRLPWDAPNRFLSWGWLPLVKKFDLAYSLEWRDGYPFSVLDQDYRLVGSPNARRFPTSFLLNVHVERRFRLLHYQWALRAGFNNVTNRHNPSAVNNNVDSPQFLTFAGLQRRTFTGRIRFLGRK